MSRPGLQPLTIVREVTMRNGRGRKSVRVLRGKRMVSNVSQNLRPYELRDISRRNYIYGLYRGVERKTRKRLRGYII